MTADISVRRSHSTLSAQTWCASWGLGALEAGALDAGVSEAGVLEADVLEVLKAGILGAGQKSRAF
jgi:hypothetical protein